MGGGGGGGGGVAGGVLGHTGLGTGRRKKKVRCQGGAGGWEEAVFELFYSPTTCPLHPLICLFTIAFLAAVVGGDKFKMTFQ